jgi:hypothetical protein
MRNEFIYIYPKCHLAHPIGILAIPMILIKELLEHHLITLPLMVITLKVVIIIIINQLPMNSIKLEQRMVVK